MSKSCSTCKEVKPLESFGKSRMREDGHHYSCKDCRSKSYRSNRSYMDTAIVDLIGEVWKDIEGYEGLYQVSNKGRVKGLSRNVSMNGGKTFRVTKEALIVGKVSTEGYKQIALALNGKAKHLFVHRLVATAFIPKLKGADIVNHLDFNKLNNCVENLEWTDQKGNIRHASEAGRMCSGSRHHEATPVIQYTIGGTFIKRYDTISEAAKVTGSHKSGIYCSCVNKTMTCNGFVWKYAV